MIITGVAEWVPDRLAGLVYLDALVPADQYPLCASNRSLSPITPISSHLSSSCVVADPGLLGVTARCQSLGVPRSRLSYRGVINLIPGRAPGEVSFWPAPGFGTCVCPSSRSGWSVSGSLAVGDGEGPQAHSAVAQLLQFTAGDLPGDEFTDPAAPGAGRDS